MVEAAIVLGVVGLVIGGIWIAASSVSENHKVTETAKGILSIVHGTRALVTPVDYPSTNMTSTTITPLLIAAKIIPSSLVQGNNAVTPWGTYLHVSLGYFGKQRIHVTLLGSGHVGNLGINQRQCTALVKRLIALSGQNSGLDLIYIDPAGGYYPPFDVSTIECPNNPINVQLEYAP